MTNDILSDVSHARFYNVGSMSINDHKCMDKNPVQAANHAALKVWDGRGVLYPKPSYLKMTFAVTLAMLNTF